MASGPPKEEIAEIFKVLKNAHRANKVCVPLAPRAPPTGSITLADKADLL